MKKFIGVDIGGTYGRFGVVNSDGVMERMIKISNEREKHLTPQMIADTIRQLREGENIAGVGVGIPGVVLPDGRITLTTNLNQLEGVPLQEYLQNELQTPVCVENDGNVAGLAEALQGAGRGYSLVYYVTISTGIGGSFIRSGEIYHGKSGFAGEIGSMIVRMSGRSYRGLYPGMIEGIASGNALRIRAERMMGNSFSNTGQIFELAKVGNEEAHCLVNDMIYALAALFSNLTYTINPEVFVLGGGCMKSGDVFLDKVIKQYQEMVPCKEARASFYEAQLEEPGVLGAGLAAAKMFKTDY